MAEQIFFDVAVLILFAVSGAGLVSLNRHWNARLARLENRLNMLNAIVTELPGHVRITPADQS